MIDKIGRFFSSLKLTVFMLIFLALVLALGTIYEAENGTPAVKVTFWRAWWFDGMLVLLSANIVGCTYYRHPKRTSRWAYLLLHQSILIIFAGGLIGRWYGSEGQLQLREGEDKSEITSEANVLNVKWLDDKGKTYDSYQFATEHIDAFLKRHETEVHFSPASFGFAERPLNKVFPMPRRGVNLCVDRFFPDFREVDGAIPGGAADGPAVQLTFTHERDTLDHWVFTRETGSQPFSGIHVTLESGSPPPVARDASSRSRGGILTLTGPNGAWTGRLDVTGREGQTLPVENTPYHVRVEKLFTHLVLEGKVPVDNPKAPENPAVVFTLSGPGLEDRRVTFANFPDFDDMHGKKKSGISAAFSFSARELQIWREPGTGALVGRFFSADDVVTGPLKAGRDYPIRGIPGMLFRVAKTMARARPGVEAINKSNELRRPGLHVNVENEVGRESFWLAFGEPRTVQFGTAKAVLEYTKVQIGVGFALKLKKFTVGKHPGTNQPASFSSDVSMDDKDLNVSGDREISMNNPLVHRGYTFYQSSYIEGTPMTSIFQVAYDPGGPVAYVGFFGFMTGLFCIISSRPKRVSAAGGTGGGPPRATLPSGGDSS